MHLLLVIAKLLTRVLSFKVPPQSTPQNTAAGNTEPAPSCQSTKPVEYGCPPEVFKGSARSEGAVRPNAEALFADWNGRATDSGILADPRNRRANLGGGSSDLAVTPGQSPGSNGGYDSCLGGGCRICYYTDEVNTAPRLSRELHTMSFPTMPIPGRHRKPARPPEGLGVREQKSFWAKWSPLLPARRHALPPYNGARRARKLLVRLAGGARTEGDCRTRA